MEQTISQERTFANLGNHVFRTSRYSSVLACRQGASGGWTNAGKKESVSFGVMALYAAPFGDRGGERRPEITAEEPEAQLNGSHRHAHPQR